MVPVMRFEGSILFIGVVQVLIENLGHGKHVDSILFEDSSHRLVASDLAAIGWILQLILPDILPDFLNCLRSRELFLNISK